MEWFTLKWLMQHLEWAVAILLFGCIILFFFPILLGWQLRQDEKKAKEKTQSSMDSLPFISILVLVFTVVIIGEIIKLKKEVRRLTKLSQHLKDDMEKQKERLSQG